MILTINIPKKIANKQHNDMPVLKTAGLQRANF